MTVLLVAVNTSLMATHVAACVWHGRCSCGIINVNTYRRLHLDHMLRRVPD